MRHTSIDIEWLYRLYVVENRSGRECARIMNRSRSTLLYHVKGQGWSRPKNQRRDEYGRFIAEGQVLPPQIMHNNPNYKNGKSIYRKIARLYGLPEFCYHCGTTDKLHVHHIDENRENNEPSNLRWVCSSCHMKIEHADRLQKRDKFGRFC